MHLNLKRFLIYSIIFIALQSAVTLIGEGFAAGALVMTPAGRARIEDFKVGDQIIAYKDKQSVPSTVAAVYRYEIPVVYKVTFGGKTISVAPDQRFYLPIDQRWIEARYLQEGHMLLQADNNLIAVEGVERLAQEKIPVFIVGVDKFHNFFVTTENVLVHNFEPTITITLVWVIGEGVSWAATGFAAFCAAYFGKKFVESIKNNPNYYVKNEIIIPEVITFNNLKVDKGAQAPGKPTPTDGFLPPKNWNGEKVRHSKTGQYGWQDKKGDVWIPTGPEGAPLAHGGPHWDVVSGDGRRHRNVMPGGRIRGEK